MLDKTCNIVSLPLGTNRYLKSGMQVTVSGPISDTVLYLLPPWFRTVIPELEGIQEESPDRLVKTQLQGGGGGVSHSSLILSESVSNYWSLTSPPTIL